MVAFKLDLLLVSFGSLVDTWVVDLLPGWVGMKIDPVEPTRAHQQ